MFRDNQTPKFVQRLASVLFPPAPVQVSAARPVTAAQVAISRRQRRRSRYGSESTVRTTWY